MNADKMMMNVAKNAFARSKETSIQKVEAILKKAAGEGDWYLCWEQKVKGTKFTLMGYFVKGEIVVVQVFDDGGIYQFLSVNTILWDLTEEIIIKHFNP